MAYATSSDIAAQFKNITFGAGKAITDTEVDSFIEQEEAVINATISNRYEVPTTGTEAVKILKNISVAYVAFRVATILNLKKDVPIPEKFAPQILNEGAKYKEAKEQLKAIQSGKIILRDAVALTTEQGVKSYNAVNSISSLWERDTKQW
jgi:hypothetical protein